MEKQLKHKILNKIDIGNLLRYFTVNEIALIFKVTPDFIWKTERLQRIIVGEIKEGDEMKLGRRGAWTLSIERKYLKKYNELVKNKKMY